MSGPKGIIIEDPAEVERRQNESQIALLRSEYASSFHIFKIERDKNYRYSGKSISTGLPSDADVRREIDRLLSSDYAGKLAVEFLKKMCRELDRETRSIKNQNQAITKQAQAKFRELKNITLDLAKGRESLLELARFSIEDNCPESIRKGIEKMEDELSSLKCPDAPSELVLDYHALKDLSDALCTANDIKKKCNHSGTPLATVKKPSIDGQPHPVVG